MTKVRHVLGISGGKDSAALAIYLNKKYKGQLDLEYYTCDTGKELAETYNLINQLEYELQTNIKKYVSVDSDAVGEDSPFAVFLKEYGGYLPSQSARWCTKKMKLEPFEKEIGDQPTVSYVGIRGDEDREGYISTRPNIQSIFPFRQNIWSVDVIKKALNNEKIPQILSYYKDLNLLKQEKVVEIVLTALSSSFPLKKKLQALLDFDTKAFNRVVFAFLKTTEYPVGKLDDFSLLENDDLLVRQDIFDIIEDSSISLPSYYLPLDYTVDGEKGKYFRSRSGCFFCFYQQKIEWVWLLETHPALFREAMKYEKDGYTWIQEESLEELRQVDRVEAIKREHLKRMKRKYKNLEKSTDWQNEILGTQESKGLGSPDWIDELLEAESDGCASCFI
jgi:3'-phosphoadenosine 5'-phosphosulfate sulfotransferase (PAPS reductase)/FAD synthetase